MRVVPLTLSVCALVAIGVLSCEPYGQGDDTVAYKGKPARLCIEGCLGPDLDIVPSTYGPLQPLGSSWHGDTLYLPDSTYYTPGSGVDMAIFFDVGPNPDDTSIVVGTSIGAICSNDCIFPTTLEEPTEGPLSIDANSSYTAYAIFQTGPVGDGTITFSAGAGEADVKVHIYHCTYRPTCG